jgi:hypothetical protein
MPASINGADVRAVLEGNTNAEIDRLNGGTFQMTLAPRPEATGTQVARAVHGGLKQ